MTVCLTPVLLRNAPSSQRSNVKKLQQEWGDGDGAEKQRPIQILDPRESELCMLYASYATVQETELPLARYRTHGSASG